MERREEDGITTGFPVSTSTNNVGGYSKKKSSEQGNWAAVDLKTFGWGLGVLGKKKDATHLIHLTPAFRSCRKKREAEYLRRGIYFEGR